MTTTVYVDGQLPAVNAAWLNDVNRVTYDLLGDGSLAPTTVAELLTNLGVLSATDLSSIYLSQADASSIYLTQANAASIYLTQANAASTYATLSGLGSYLLSSTAAATYAPLVSPNLTGVPTAPTATTGTNTTQIATTAFVEQEIAAATISSITEGTPQATTSGTSITFGSLPSTVKRIVIMFQGVGSDGGSGSTTEIDLTLGTGSGFETAGYSSFSGLTAHDVDGNVTSTTTVNTANFVLASVPSIGLLYSGAIPISGAVVLSRLNSSTNLWTLNGNLGCSIGVHNVGGSKALSDVITQVKISLASHNFDSGSINIHYES